MDQYRYPAEPGDFIVIQGEDALTVPKDPARVDVIIGRGECSPGSALYDSMLGWRAHPHTYLAPCWFPVEKETFAKTCLWPRLAIDRFAPEFQAERLPEWLAAVADWQQNRMLFGNSGGIEKSEAPWNWRPPCA